MSTLISAENSIGLFAVLSAICALAIFLEQRYAWASKVTGCIMVLLATLVLSNLHIIPESASAYDFVGSYLVPMALPLLLFKADIKSIVKDSGRLIILFLIGAVGTCVGAAVAYFVISGRIEEAPKFIAMITGSYIGGGINFVAMADNYLSACVFRKSARITALARHSMVSLMFSMWSVSLFSKSLKTSPRGQGDFKSALHCLSVRS